MRKILGWWGIRGGVALLLGAGMAALTGSAIFGAMVTGLVMLVVASVAWEAYSNRGNAAYGNRLRRSGGAADGVPHDAGVAGVGTGVGDGGCGGGGFDGGGGFGGGDGGGGGGC